MTTTYTAVFDGSKPSAGTALLEAMAFESTDKVVFWKQGTDVVVIRIETV